MRAVALMAFVALGVQNPGSALGVTPAESGELAETASVESIRPPSRVAIAGFDLANDGSHMFEWLGRGKDFRQFFVNDLERELYAQDPGSLLLSAECLAKPEYVSKALRDDPGSSQPILTEFSVSMPLLARVSSSKGEMWRLRIDFGYHMTGMDVPANRKLQLKFQVVTADRE